MSVKTLTVEHIKKIFKHFPDLQEFEESTEFSGNEVVLFRSAEGSFRGSISCLEAWHLYPHFLTRVIEAIHISTKTAMYIDFNSRYMDYCYVKGETFRNSYVIDIHHIDQAKTEAILYILDRIGD